MQLRIKRSQSMGIMGGLYFCIDAKVHLTDKERKDVEAYHLGSQVIYNSEKSKKHLNQFEAETAFRFGAKEQVKGLIKGAAQLAMAALSLNVSINDLILGKRIECKDLQELLGAEEAIYEACNTMKVFLDTAAAFLDGEERVIDFDDEAAVAALEAA